MGGDVVREDRIVAVGDGEGLEKEHLARGHRRGLARCDSRPREPACTPASADRYRCEGSPLILAPLARFEYPWGRIRGLFRPRGLSLFDRPISAKQGVIDPLIRDSLEWMVESDMSRGVAEKGDE